MTFNIRVDVPVPENSWSDRKDKVAEVIHQEAPIIVGLQEATPRMLSQLMDELPSYSWIGKPRRKEDECSPILYQKDKVELHDSTTFWLSETPEVEGSMSWDTSFPRICTWGEFSLKAEPSTRFRIFNTHLDHISEEARIQGIRLIKDTIHSINEKQPLPTILMGDFNDTPNSEALAICEKEMRYTNAFTYINEDEKKRKTFHDFNGGIEGEPIDYIFASSDIMLSQSKIIRTKIQNRYPSDHYPVTMMATFPS
ncbi:endonuclease/exonuclease/phosphatase family protein [Fictibacillus phosphorivorans]|uniref:endonuclease/exonuclease/phosphatase family protein n=1 Tax=Fictibacillus phosphorivorans TaxID=1221500 RepID=UPI00203FEB01|nr:endonuclease/exonuclease/phosphatase family protein [Fictibacillus phosphorivorans]MCM3717727.1 endonuclease/exonuclease/phosphatase family protein [Fictibacillus phosphorivorans]MCM3775627.1 endonuclease/exonuclease/phosphatase family protein [Fictibacillus phosphorivorans]